MSVIAVKDSRAYGSAMVAAFLRLLTLVALVLMPLGMAGAPAIAQPVPADHAAMAMKHCDEQPDPDKAPVTQMDCTAMCTALPAAEGPEPAPVLKLECPLTLAIDEPFAGIEPELATPPPRRG